MPTSLIVCPSDCLCVRVCDGENGSIVTRISSSPCRCHCKSSDSVLYLYIKKININSWKCIPKLNYSIDEDVEAHGQVGDGCSVIKLYN